MNRKKLLISTSLFFLASLSIMVYGAEPEWGQFSHSQPRLHWGFASRKGNRNYFEDDYIASIDLADDPSQSLFAVMDGHEGVNAANYTAHRLPILFRKITRPLTMSANDYLAEIFKNLDDEILAHQDIKSGAVIVAAYIYDNNKVKLAWVGDSRGIIIRRGNVIDATEDHKADNPREKERIEALGGSVYKDKFGISRVQGLAPSRVLGDRHVKFNDQGMPSFIVSAVPSFHVSVALQQGDTIVLACDGVWDVLRNENVAMLVEKTQEFIARGSQGIRQIEEAFPERPLMRSSAKDPKYEKEFSNEGYPKQQLIARVIRDTAYNNKSNDNISVLVITYGDIE